MTIRDRDHSAEQAQLADFQPELFLDRHYARSRHGLHTEGSFIALYVKDVGNGEPKLMELPFELYEGVLLPGTPRRAGSKAHDRVAYLVKHKPIAVLSNMTENAHIPIYLTETHLRNFPEGEVLELRCLEADEYSRLAERNARHATVAGPHGRSPVTAAQRRSVVIPPAAWVRAAAPVPRPVGPLASALPAEPFGPFDEQAGKVINALVAETQQPRPDGAALERCYELMMSDRTPPSWPNLRRSIMQYADRLALLEKSPPRVTTAQEVRESLDTKLLAAVGLAVREIAPHGQLQPAAEGHTAAPVATRGLSLPSLG